MRDVCALASHRCCARAALRLGIAVSAQAIRTKPTPTARRLCTGPCTAVSAKRVLALLAAGATVDAANRYGVRPAYLAAENGDAATMHALLEAGADPRATFAEGETLLMTAARTGDVATIEALLAAGAASTRRKAAAARRRSCWQRPRTMALRSPH